VNDALVRARSLGKRFGAVTALAGVDLDVVRGECFALVGPNGAGKSTLLRLIAGLAHPTSGTCEVDVPGDRRAAIGYVGHSTLLYPDLTARENLVFAARLQRVPRPAERADALLAEEGLAAVADRRTGGFSRGMAQRLSIARARVHEPTLLLLDEPYTGLDRHAADRLTARLGALAGGPETLVLVTHDVARAATLADGLAVLESGHLRALWRGESLAAPALEARYLHAIGESAA